MPPTNDLILMKIGADPEALFWSRNEKTVIPAYQLCGGRSACRSWIGTDGHATTAELRPTPSKNVLMVLADLASAMGVIEKNLNALNARTNLDLVVVAEPAFAGEPLGGHIHLSYWYEQTNPVLFRQGEHDFGHVYVYLHAFLSPLLSVAGGINRGEYTYRPQPLPSNKYPPRKNMLPARVEFRRPGTWLSSPVLAFTFLGLTKLAILNYPRLSGAESHKEYITFLRTLKTTSDLTTLVDTVDYVLANPPKWYQKTPALVDFAAWRDVLGED